MSVTSIVGTCRFDGSKASGTVAVLPFALNCQAPAGLFVSSHSCSNRFSKKWLLHFVGVCDQMTSGPPVIASAPVPVPNLLLQPRPCSSIGAASGAVPTSDGSPAPWVLPKV